MKTGLILGCGYVGRALALSRRSSGDRVFAVTRNEDTADGLASEGLELFRGAVQGDDWHDWAQDIDWAVNCVSSAGGGLAGYRSSYVEGNRSFVDWMDKSGFEGRAIYTSSVSVYPDSQGEWVGEDDASPHSERAEIMLEAEKAFLAGPHCSAKVVMRLGGIYGPGRSFLAKRVREADGVLPGYGDYFLNLIRLEDIVSAIEVVLDISPGKGGVFNVVDNQPKTKAELVTGLASAMGVGPLSFDPNLVASRSSRKSNGERPANRRISNKRFRDAFGWAPRFPDGLAGMSQLISS
ncbi:MAG TPA: hypothetical protein DIV79_12510 [Opitutae bacterium]|nr:hypothetical protein [Opitutae bacterium]